MSEFADLHEVLLVEQLLGHGLQRRVLLSLLGLSGRAHARASVRKPFLRDPDPRPGDIDLLAWADPSRAVVVEVKAVKAKPEAFDEGGRLSRLLKAQRGSHQANALADLGFSRTYLLVVALVDGSQRAELNWLHRGLTWELRDSITAAAIARWELRDDVGLLYLEVVKPTDQPIHEAAGLSPLLIKPAAERIQREELTAQIASLPNQRSRLGE